MADRINRIGRRFVVSVSVAAAVVSMSWSIPTRAQSSPKPQFAVASIKQRTDGGSASACCLGAGGRLNVKNQRVSNIIGFAWTMKYYQLVGGPSWLESDRFDIEATAEGSPSQDEMKQMLQSLLEERFHLKVHQETRQLPAYTLTLAKGGSKMQAFKEGDCIKYDPSTPASPSTPIRPRDFCGFNVLTQGRWNASGITMQQVTSALADITNRPVIDNTELSGLFNIHTEYPEDELSPDSAAHRSSP
ncbi:MAG: TIGR03435 family protein [Bryobacterales bacterium]|nr:TIGR03435 family protein [Bryobacterales bacterium]